MCTYWFPQGVIALVTQLGCVVKSESTHHLPCDWSAFLMWIDLMDIFVKFNYSMTGYRLYIWSEIKLHSQIFLSFLDELSELTLPYPIRIQKQVITSTVSMYGYFDKKSAHRTQDVKHTDVVIIRVFWLELEWCFTKYNPIPANTSHLYSRLPFLCNKHCLWYPQRSLSWECWYTMSCHMVWCWRGINRRRDLNSLTKPSKSTFHLHHSDNNHYHSTIASLPTPQLATN